MHNRGRSSIDINMPIELRPLLCKFLKFSSKINIPCIYILRVVF